MSLAETVVLGVDGRARLNREIAERLARVSERLGPRPVSEDPHYLVARSVTAACGSEDPIGAVLEDVAPLDGRTIVMMYVALVAELSRPPDLLKRESDALDVLVALRDRDLDVSARVAGAHRVANMYVLGYSAESSARWAERRMSGLMADRLEAELDG